MSSPISSYLKHIEQALKAGNATEHTHRPALKNLIEQVRDKVTATNEPQRIACGAPDYIITQKEIPLGYVEAKDVGVDLDAAEETDQLLRYRRSLSNLILTDYLEFRLYRNGDLVQTVDLAKKQKSGKLVAAADGEQKLLLLLHAFLDAQAPTIGTARELAERMARIAKLIDDLIRQAFVQEGTQGDLHGQYDAFKKVLISDLSTDQFADMYAQTIAYGLFAARCNHEGPGFRRELAGKELPKTNPFLRRLFNSVAGADLDDRIAWAVDDLAELLARADMPAILSDFGKATAKEDPVVHFYETFLAAYDPKLRELRGVYYTPEPVVDYIVRSVDAVLKQDFKLKEGLADRTRVKLKRPKPGSKGEETYETHRVQILDPACGTGTFLHSVFANVEQRFTGNKGLWPTYVAEHLLPRVYGFELLMAPYAVAHMKLGLQLRDTGYDFAADERLRVFLTNTLEEAHEMTGLPLFTQWLAAEAAAAGEVKKNVPIMVVLGNPPYSGHSANKGGWISGLMDEYKRSPALKKPAQAKWLSDDYVKFIRFAQWRIEQTGHGVLAFITNHSYLDNPTFLDMRASLMASFNDIYLLDLHGNSKKKEKAPDGSKDENVFDIQQGVAIAILVKKGGKVTSPKVKRADLWGLRPTKYEWLLAHDIADTPWEDITPVASPWFFVRQDAALLAEYEKGWSVADIFKLNGDPAPGVVTTQDDFAISWTREEALDKVSRLLATTSEAEARDLFKLCSQSQWSYDRAKKDLAGGEWHNQATPILYRPFDVRWTIWNSNVAVHRRERVFSHVVGRENLLLITARSNKTGRNDHFLVSDMPSETKCGESSTQSHVLPLWLYPEGNLLGSSHDRVANLSAEFMSALAARLGGNSPKPEQIFAYIYAVLYSRAYRERFSPFLRRDFPRVPLPKNATQFSSLTALGHELIDLHLGRKVVPAITKFPKPGSNTVETVDFQPDGENPGLGRVAISASQYFEGVPIQAWEYTVGGYQVLQKWLKDRKRRTLSFDDLQHYTTVVATICKTIAIQSAIDKVLAD